MSLGEFEAVEGFWLHFLARFLGSLGRSTGERFLPSLSSSLEISLRLRISREKVNRMASDFQRKITQRQQTRKCNIVLISFAKPFNLYRLKLVIQALQGHPTSKLSQKPLRDVSRLLAMYKDCLKREFDLFGYLS